MDIKTLYLCNSLIFMLLAVITLFYRLTQKTYEGFGYLTISSFFYATAFGAFLLRFFVNEWASILLVNTFTILGFLLRTDGLSRFCWAKPIPRWLYALMVPYLWATVFWFGGPNGMSGRSVVLSVTGVVFLIWQASVLWFSSLQVGQQWSRMLSLPMGCLVLVTTGRMLYIVANPDAGLLEANPFHVSFHLGVLVVETLLNFGFLMLNSSRLEDELEKTNQELSGTLWRLQDANSQIKVLSGILPICCHCKKIRDTNEWRILEEYIQKHSGADFSHGICPECLAIHYPQEP